MAAKPPVKKLSTPQSFDTDGVISKDYLDKPFVVESVEKVKSNFKDTETGLYRDQFILIGHAPNSKKSERMLCGGTVLVKTIEQFLESDGQFPFEVTCVKGKGVRYFTFE